MWTRFLPIAEAIKTIVNSGELGDVKVLHADLAGDFKLDSEIYTIVTFSTAKA